ncbi:magnesium transporter [Nevskia sp.]|uniref:magnesium transporter n=1 Tax=Nevskia sp. TaxID=1929292 RepID=UPI003F6E9058
MNADTATAALTLRYLLDYPREAARRLERLPAEDIAAVFTSQPLHALMPVWRGLTSDIEQAVLPLLPAKIARHILTELEPTEAVALLNRVGEDRRSEYLALLNPEIADELRASMARLPDSAGALMDPRFLAFDAALPVAEALRRLRRAGRRSVREIYLVGDGGRLEGRVEIQDLALAEPEQLLADLRQPIIAVVDDSVPREEVVEALEQHETLTELPVIDFSGRLIGVIHQAELVNAMQEETSLDIQTMVGASKDERALSSPLFAVAKRLPWLQINLLTAFLAASVVGLFEGVISKYTALAVLLPVVAGQSGNAGAQALAVTMRGLMLREISIRHWPRVVAKEVGVGLLNGLGIAATTAIGVYVWSRSFGLVLVIATAMVISMVAAGFAGALVPIMLRRFGQDPAQSSSIILTTVTDVVGFFSFLGIATLFSGMLTPS